ncbi:hypothetical protein GF352_01045 [archaeon]|nr:hypothetical protein [archaeon]
MSIQGLRKITDSIASLPGVKGVMMVTREGLPLVSNIPRIDEVEFSTMSAALIGASQTITQSLDMGDERPEFVFLRSNHTDLLFYLLGQVIIVVLASASVETRLIIDKIKSVSDKILALIK